LRKNNIIPYLGKTVEVFEALLEVKVGRKPADITCPILIKPASNLISSSSLPYPRTTTGMPAPADLLSYIDKNSDAFIKRLADAVAIPS
jgi:hypothetical protein